MESFFCPRGALRSCISLVCGHCQAGRVEDEIKRDILRSTLKKEVREEVNIEIADDMELVYNNSFRRVDGAHVVNLTFLCHYKSGEARPLEDTIKVKWFSVEELRNFPEDFLQIEIEKLVKYLERMERTP